MTFEFTANAFLQHMVRNLVGTLVAVGSGELEPQDAARILERRDRREAGVTAPPEGLALVEVLYPPQLRVAALRGRAVMPTSGLSAMMPGVSGKKRGRKMHPAFAALPPSMAVV